MPSMAEPRVRPARPHREARRQGGDAPRRQRDAWGGEGAKSVDPVAPDTSDLAQALMDAMAAIRRTARRVAGSPALLSDLTGSQLELVRIVRRRPGISVADAAEELRLAPNTVSTLVGQLTDAGIIVRATDRSDRRVARLALDPVDGRSLVTWYDKRAAALAAVLARIPPPERQRLHDAQEVLSTVAVLLEEDATAAERAANRRLGRGRSSRRSDPGRADTSPQ